MKKGVKITLEIIAFVVLLVVLLPLFLTLALQLDSVQQFIARKFADAATNKLGVEVNVDKLSLKLFNRAEVEGFYVEDPYFRGDTLFYIEKADAKLGRIELSTGKVILDYAKVKGGKLYIRTDSRDSINIKAVTDKLKSHKAKRKEFKMLISKIEGDGFDFRYTKFKPRKIESGMNVEDMRFNNIEVSARDFNLHTDSIYMKIDSLAFKESSGMNVLSVTADSLIVSPDLISIKDGYALIDSSSVNLPSFSMKFDHWQMQDFVNKVDMDIEVGSSDVSMATVARFTGKNFPWSNRIKLKGRAQGIVNNLWVEAESIECSKTHLSNVTARMTDVVDVPNSYFDVDVPILTTTSDDISLIATQFTGKQIVLPPQLQNMGTMNLQAQFSGKIKDFSFMGELKSLVGGVVVDADIAFAPKERMDINATVSSSGIDLGMIMPGKKLGNLIFDGEVKGHYQPHNSNLAFKNNIIEGIYNSYNYSNIYSEGKMVGDNISLATNSGDPNAKFRFKGSLNSSQAQPTYKFHLGVRNLNLAALNFNKKDSLSLLSFNVSTNGYGVDIDQLNTQVVIEKINYTSSRDSIRNETIYINSDSESGGKRIDLYSSFADVKLLATHSLLDIVPFFKQGATKHIPSLKENKDYSKILATELSKSLQIADSTQLEELKQHAYNNDYLVMATVKNSDNLTSIFAPSLSIAEGTSLSLGFSTVSKKLFLSLFSDNITFGNQAIKGLRVSCDNKADSLFFNCKASEVDVSSIYMPNVEIKGYVANNNIGSKIMFNNPNDNSGADIKSLTTIINDAQSGELTANVHFYPSTLSAFGSDWEIDESRSRFLKNVVDINNFKMVSGAQTIGLNGILSKSEQDTLALNFKNLDISQVSRFTSPLGYNFEGEMGGAIKLTTKESAKLMFANIELDSLKLNQYNLPPVRVLSRYNPATSNTMKYLVLADSKPIISADLNLSTKKFKADVELKSVPLSPLDPFMKSIGNSCDGVESMKITLDNQFRPLNINGTVDIESFATTINFTKVRYEASGQVEIKDNVYTLKNGVAKDKFGTTAPMTGSLDCGDIYRRVKYSIGLRPSSMLCLDTNLSDNPLFYGTVYGSGAMNVIGEGTKVVMNVTASAVNNSRFYMPLSDKTSITEADFIKFKKPEPKEVEVKRDFLDITRKKREVAQSSFVMNMNVAVGSDTEAQLVIDPTLGDIIKTRGTGDFNIHIEPLKSIFTLDGSYEITSGDYLFTLPNFELVNKYFIINPGSSITWNGDPLGANLAITATYKTKTSLAPLLGALPQYNRRVEVDCNMNLSGQLLHPDINLGIAVPEADPETKGLIASALNTEEAVSRQIFWLLFSNSFYTDATTTGTNVTVGMMGTAGAVTGIEFLSNQISNWISSDKFDLGVNYRPKSDLSSDEVELNISAPLLNNRLLLEAEGYYDFQNNAALETENSKALSGNFYVTYIIDNMGNLRLKAFTRQINTFDENQGLQESGVGVYYKESFNNINDLIATFKKNRAARKMRREERKSEKSEK